jgi:dihydrofolate reductase
MLSIIVAISKNNIIGKEGKLPWYLPNDLKRFREVTTGHKIIMGRKTYESLPKILPNRQHIVLTRDKNFNI